MMQYTPSDPLHPFRARHAVTPLEAGRRDRVKQLSQGISTASKFKVNGNVGRVRQSKRTEITERSG
jgi:hypothetical protein